MNSTVWRLTAIETLELPVLSRTMHQFRTTKLWLPWTHDETLDPTRRKDFNFCVLLNMLLSFCEDYKRVIVNARHELILIRSRNDYNCLVGYSVNLRLNYSKWRMPHVALNEINKLSIMLHWKAIVIWVWVFRSEICMSIFCYRRPWAVMGIHGLSKRRLNLRSRDTLSLLRRPVERMLCLEMLVCSMIVIWVTWKYI